MPVKTTPILLLNRPARRPVSRLLAIGLLVLNDHVLKDAFHNALTGKLSDFAGMAFFPLLLQGLWEGAQSLLRRSWQPSRRALWICAAATALVGITSHIGLVYRARLKAGETLFINGGSGGIGSLKLRVFISSRVI